ncbi:MAG TPA: ABC transporter ATP-binding protein [Thermoplasmata archaeon]|nr:ABC transporter ATP-binding protein [Thermoplasmata archaeon]
MTVDRSRGLEVEDLTVRYGRRLAVSAVSLEVAPGEVVALAGPNGSGKSSLIRAVATHWPGAQGSVRVDGTSLLGLPPLERARRVAWMPQEEPPGDDVPLTDYVEYGRYAYLPRWSGPSPGDRAAVFAALDAVDLAAFSDRGLLSLSGGERQRARLARALAQRTQVLLLDEPTAHLDVGHQLDVLERVRAHAHREQRAVLVALHDLNLAARFTDRIAVLSRGRLRTVGRPREVLSAELLAEVWGVIAEMRSDPMSGLPYLIPRLPAPAAPLRSHRRPFRVHVIAGGGAGAALLRAALDSGWEVSAGVLPLFDTDSDLARELGIPAVVELPFSPIGPESLARMDGLLDTADAVVVAPFPVGPGNLPNLEHLVERGARRPTLLIDHPPTERWDFTGGRGEAAVARLAELGADRVSDVGGALRWLEAHSARRPAANPSA